MFSTFNSFNSQIQKKNIKISLIPSPQIWLKFLASTFSIGKNDYDWNARNFTGNIGDIRFFTTALTEEQITYIYNNSI